MTPSFIVTPKGAIDDIWDCLLKQPSKPSRYFILVLKTHNAETTITFRERRTFKIFSQSNNSKKKESIFRFFIFFFFGWILGSLTLYKNASKNQCFFLERKWILQGKSTLQVFTDVRFKQIMYIKGQSLAHESWLRTLIKKKFGSLLLEAIFNLTSPACRGGGEQHSWKWESS